MKNLFESKNIISRTLRGFIFGIYTLVLVLSQNVQAAHNKSDPDHAKLVSLEKKKENFRNYDQASEHVKNFYCQNHEQQTVDFVINKKEEFINSTRAQMTIWEAIALLDTINDESDPDLANRPQSYHAYQTAEALRHDGQPEWFVLAGFIHDLGKILTTFGEPQWAVVGDTFPVGCKYSDKIIFYDYFKNNPDATNPTYNTEYGIYSTECGLDNVIMSWGHDEYLYQVLKNTNLPPETLFIIRYHSFYAAHDQGAYQHLMNEHDKEMLTWLKLFSEYDLYSKSSAPLDVESIKPYYQRLVNAFLPETLNW